MFFLPCMLWRAIADTSAINIKDLIDVAMKSTIDSPESQKKTISYLCKHIDICLHRQRQQESTGLIKTVQFYLRCFLTCGRRYGNFLFISYMVIKVIYIINTFGQILLLNSFLEADGFFYGAQLLDDLQQGITWQESGMFPRVTFCDLDVKVLGNKHRHTVQCVLPINMFNEKVFIFLWFIFFIVFIVTIISFFQWFIQMCFRKRTFIIKYLQLWNVINVNDKEEMKLFYTFVYNYLRADGVFCLRMIHKNTGELIVGEIMAELWRQYKIVNQVSLGALIPRPRFDVSRKDDEPALPRKIDPNAPPLRGWAKVRARLPSIARLDRSSESASSGGPPPDYQAETLPARRPDNDLPLARLDGGEDETSAEDVRLLGDEAL